jgi:hypothetical protein
MTTGADPYQRDTPSPHPATQRTRGPGLFPQDPTVRHPTTPHPPR